MQKTKLKKNFDFNAMIAYNFSDLIRVGGNNNCFSCDGCDNCDNGCHSCNCDSCDSDWAPCEGWTPGGGGWGAAQQKIASAKVSLRQKLK